MRLRTDIKYESKNLYEIKMQTNVVRFKSGYKRKLRGIIFRLNLASRLQVHLDTLRFPLHKAVTSRRRTKRKKNRAPMKRRISQCRVSARLC